jgi:hypothetical protein
LAGAATSRSRPATAPRVEQRGERAATVEPGARVDEGVDDHLSTWSISRRWLSCSTCAGRRARGPRADLVELDRRRASGAVGTEDHAFGPDAPHGLADQLRVRAGRRLEHDVLAALGDRDRILAVEVRAHVAEHDRRLGHAERGLLQLEGRAKRVVAAVDQGRRTEPGRRADQP